MILILGFRLLSAVVSTIGVTGRLPLLLSGTIGTEAKSIVIIFNAERVIFSWVQVLAPKLHTQDHMPVAIRKFKGIFRLHLGCADTQWTSSIVSVVLDGLG